MRLPWRRSPSPNLSGIVAVLRLLLSVSCSQTLLLSLGVLMAALLPIGATVVTGLLVGSIPIRPGLRWGHRPGAGAGGAGAGDAG